MDNTLGHGDLLLLAVALSAAALADLQRSQRGGRGLIRTILLGCAVVLIAGATYWFSDVAELLKDDPKKLNTTFIATYSMWVFMGAVVIGGCCVIMSALPAPAASESGGDR